MWYFAWILGLPAWSCPRLNATAQMIGTSTTSAARAPLGGDTTGPGRS